MITYLPSHIIAKHAGGVIYDPRQPRDHLPLYEHFARKVLAWNLPRELLIDTSGIGYAEFGPLSSQEAVETVLAKLFAAAGTASPRGTFLKRCGLRRWTDLAKPIRLRGRAATATMFYDVRERRLKEPGPNEYHPGAVYGQGTYFQFGWDRRWRFVLRYGYSHDSSSWSICVRQGREALSTFVDTVVPQWLNDTLVEEAWAATRQCRNRDHDSLSEAVRHVFGWECYGPSPGTISTDALVLALLDGRRPRLTKRRLGVVQGWMKADRRKEEARNA